MAEGNLPEVGSKLYLNDYRNKFVNSAYKVIRSYYVVSLEIARIHDLNLVSSDWAEAESKIKMQGKYLSDYHPNDKTFETSTYCGEVVLEKCE